MNVISFVIRSFFLSFPVALFWLPALAITFYAVYLGVGLLIDEPVALGMLVVLLYSPLQFFLMILAVRGGMTILRVTSGSDLGKLGGVTWRAMRFNGSLGTTIVNIFMWATIIAGLKILTPEFLEEFREIREGRGVFQDYYLEQLFQTFPIILLLGAVFGLVVAIATFATNFAGIAAMAVDNPPRHDQLWGIGGQFLNLFVTGMLFLFVPSALLIWFAGGETATSQDWFSTYNVAIFTYQDFTLTLNSAIVIYAMWATCLIAAAAALAYKVYLGVDEERRKRDIEEMTGLINTGPKVDLKALRQARMGGQIVPVSAGYVDDDDDDYEFESDDEDDPRG